MIKGSLMSGSTKTLNGIQLMVLLGLLLVGFAMEVQGVAPCLLCQMQRVGLGVMGILALLSRLMTWRGWWVMQGGVLCLMMGLSVHHIRMLGVPHFQGETCLPSLSWALETLPWTQWGTLLSHSDACRALPHAIGGIKLPVWLLVAQVGLAMLWMGEGFWRQSAKEYGDG